MAMECVPVNVAAPPGQKPSEAGVNGADIVLAHLDVRAVRREHAIRRYREQPALSRWRSPTIFDDGICDVREGTGHRRSDQSVLGSSLEGRQTALAASPPVGGIAATIVFVPATAIVDAALIVMSVATTVPAMSASVAITAII